MRPAVPIDQIETWPDLPPAATREYEQLAQAMVDAAHPYTMLSPPRLRALLVLADAEYRRRYGPGHSRLGWSRSVWLPTPKAVDTTPTGPGSARVSGLRHRRHLRDCSRAVWRRHGDQTLVEVAADARDAARFMTDLLAGGVTAAE